VFNILRTKQSETVSMLCGAAVQELNARMDAAPRSKASRRIAGAARKNWIAERWQHCGPMN